METTTAIKTFLISRQAKGLSKRTISWYRIILDHFGRMYPEVPNDPVAIDQFMVQCSGGDERRHGYFRTIRVFYRFLSRRYDIKNIALMVDAPKRRPKAPRPLTLDELNQLLVYPHRKRVKAALMFMVDCGARVGEVARLTPQDLSETEYGPIARVTGKTGTRLVPIGETTFHILCKVLPFPYGATQLSRHISWAFRDAHIRGTAHSLRHTFATYWDGDDDILQYILGHSHISTTLIYRKLRTRKMCEQYQKFNPLKSVMSGYQLEMMDKRSGLF